MRIASFVCTTTLLLAGLAAAQDASDGARRGPGRDADRAAARSERDTRRNRSEDANRNSDQGSNRDRDRGDQRPPAPPSQPQAQTQPCPPPATAAPTAAVTPPTPPRPGQPAVTPPMPPGAPTRPPMPPGARPGPMGAVLDEGLADQETRIQMELFQVACPVAKLITVDVNALQQADLSTADLMKMVKELGSTQLLFRLDDRCNLGRAVQINAGKTVPVVTDASVQNGKLTPSINYQSVGTTMELTGRWLDAGQGWRCSMACKIQSSSLAETTTKTGSGVTLNSFNKLSLERSVLLKSESPIVFMTNDTPSPAEGDDAITTVYIIRLRVIRAG